MEAIIYIGGQSRVNVSMREKCHKSWILKYYQFSVPVIELAVQCQEDLIVIDEWSNEFCVWPFSLRKVLFGQLIPPPLVRGIDFRHIVVQYRLVKMQNKLFGRK